MNHQFVPETNAKASMCFPVGALQQVVAYIITAKNKNKTQFGAVCEGVVAKQKIRNIFNVGDHSIHISDSKEETVRLVKYLLDEDCDFKNNKG